MERQFSSMGVYMKRKITAPRMRLHQDRLSFLWLGIGFSFLLFGNGVNIIPISTWIGMAFFVRFMRTQKTSRALLIGYIAVSVLFLFQWRLIFSGVGKSFVIYAVAFGLLGFLPYLIDRLISPQLDNFLGTLVLPLAWVLCEYIFHLVLPLKTFFSLAYTQYENLPLLQIMSVTGMWGIVFILPWFASVVNFVWERKFVLQEIWKGVLIYGSILILILYFGGLRLSVFRPDDKRVRVATVTSNLDMEVFPEDGTQAADHLYYGNMKTKELAALKDRIEKNNTNLIEATVAEARAGSKIIVWNEYDAHILREDETKFVKRMSNIARQEEIYLCMLLISIESDVTKRELPDNVWENKVVFINPDGEVAFEYVKANLLIGPEMQYGVAGPKTVYSMDSPYGTLSSVICLDLDVPGFIRLAGKGDADILCAGAIDGSGGAKDQPLHALMAGYRAIENGMSVVRGGHSGYSIAFDYHGRIVSMIPHYAADGRTMVAQVPTKGVKTIYSIIGDLFAWLCCGGFLVVTVLAILTPKRKRK
jgi:apolipoprotein N-acyltransferase